MLAPGLAAGIGLQHCKRRSFHHALGNGTRRLLQRWPCSSGFHPGATKTHQSDPAHPFPRQRTCPTGTLTDDDGAWRPELARKLLQCSTVDVSAHGGCGQHQAAGREWKLTTRGWRLLAGFISLCSSWTLLDVSYSVQNSGRRPRPCPNTDGMRAAEHATNQSQDVDLWHHFSLPDA